MRWEHAKGMRQRGKRERGRTLMVSRDCDGIESMRATSRFRSFQMKIMSKLRRLNPTRSRLTTFTSARAAQERR